MADLENLRRPFSFSVAERKERALQPPEKKKKAAKENYTSPGGNASEISPLLDQQQQRACNNIESTMSISRAGNGTTQACAACKYQRRKCAPDCILAPYFPHDRQRQFLNAHKLFGVSNITKIIKNLNPPEKDEAMRTIIFQSDVRASDPVGGCYRMIRELQRQIEYSKAELDLVLHQLAICRAQVHQQSTFQAQEAAGDDSTRLGCHDQMVNATTAAAVAAVDPFEIYDPVLQYHYAQPHPDQQEFVVPDNHHHQHLQEDASAWSMQESSCTMSTSSPYMHVKQPYDNGCDDFKPVLDMNDVKFETDEFVEKRKSYDPQKQVQHEYKQKEQLIKVSGFYPDLTICSKVFIALPASPCIQYSMIIEFHEIKSFISLA
ncbi:hypothetical protein Tsubulata_026727 [Turnera subulata]|uniref:LOB domain-containing protein n=1 Tax=Turnera subulata TaxID=218843 RepID=A0A9Q0JMB8_9ROSI|nr:hypothetical protein Tsubulata_026727 [Turnera subulata]